jgi:hypothetical protein
MENVHRRIKLLIEIFIPHSWTTRTKKPMIQYHIHGYLKFLKFIRLIWI